MTGPMAVSTRSIMFHVTAAMVPGLLVHSWFFGSGILLTCLVAVIAALLAEIACTRTLRDVGDGSALVTGLLVGVSLPPDVAWHIPLIASLVAIVLAKHAYGGLGQNIFNPAMAGYAAVLVAFPDGMLHYDAVTGATALEVMSHRDGATIHETLATPSVGFLGAHGYEWTNVAFALGGGYLLCLRVIKPHIPFAVLAGIGIPALVLYDAGSSASWGSPLFHWFSGGTMLAAFFVATDPVTSPARTREQWLYGLLIGALTLVIRATAAWPDGIAFAVLLGNLLAPSLERLSSNRSRNS